MPKETSTKKKPIQTPKTIGVSDPLIAPTSIPAPISPSPQNKSTREVASLNFFQLFWKLKVFLVSYLLYNVLFGLVSFGSTSVIFNSVFVAFSIIGNLSLYIILGIEISKKLVNTGLISSWIAYLAKSCLFLGLVFCTLAAINFYIIESIEGPVRIQSVILEWLSSFVYNFFLVGIMGSFGVFIDSMILSRKSQKSN
jgi:hypothetical protein